MTTWRQPRPGVHRMYSGNAPVAEIISSTLPKGEQRTSFNWSLLLPRIEGLNSSGVTSDIDEAKFAAAVAFKSWLTQARLR